MPWEWFKGETPGWCLDWAIPPPLPYTLWPLYGNMQRKMIYLEQKYTQRINVDWKENSGGWLFYRESTTTSCKWTSGQKQKELSYLSKGNSVVEEGMGLVDSGWWVQRAKTLLSRAPILIGQRKGLSQWQANGRPYSVVMKRGVGQVEMGRNWANQDDEAEWQEDIKKSDKEQNAT